DADPRQRRRQDDEDDRKPVDAQLVLDAEQRNPVGGLDELEPGDARMEADEQDERGDPRDERRRQRGRAGQGPRQDRDEDRAGQRQERHERPDRQPGTGRRRPASRRYGPAMTSRPTAIPSPRSCT